MTVEADPAEAHTRGAVTLDVTVLDSDSNEVVVDAGDLEFDFATVSGDPTPLVSGADVSSVSIGVTSVTVSYDGVDSTPLELTFVGAPVAPGDVVINELLADGTAGDANGDGSTNGDEDTFVEFVSIATVDLSLEGAQIFEVQLTSLARHTFDEGDTLLAGEAVVVFGGGVPTGAPAGSTFVAADNAGDPGDPFYLHLDPLGDAIFLKDELGTELASVAWGTEAGGTPDANIDQSITLDPQITGSTWSSHTDVSGSGTSLYSPGTLAERPRDRRTAAQSSPTFSAAVRAAGTPR